MPFLSINSHTIRANAVNGTDDPPIRIVETMSSKSPRYAREVKLGPNSRLIYDPTKALLACGARLVLETDSVEIIR